MRCPEPILIKNKYGYIREVPCGQCKACRLNRASEFANRIMNEASFHKCNTFLTLTYDDEHLPEHGSLDKEELQKFQKRLRKRISDRLRFYSVGEYGDRSNRCHYHLIVFGLSPVDSVFKDMEYDKKHDGWRCYMDEWPYGLCFTAPVTYDDACYVAKYCMKKLTGEKGKQYYEDREIAPPFVMMSNRPGIGFKYLEKNAKKIARRGYIIGKNGQKCPIPRYYKQKIWSSLGLFTRSIPFVEQKREEIKIKAAKQCKSIYEYEQDLIEGAKNKVESFLKMKGKRDEI